MTLNELQNQVKKATDLDKFEEAHRAWIAKHYTKYKKYPDCAENGLWSYNYLKNEQIEWQAMKEDRDLFMREGRALAETMQKFTEPYTCLNKMQEATQALDRWQKATGMNIYQTFRNEF